MTVAQKDVIAWLSDPASWGGGASAVERIDTHASIIFLTGPLAYKLKRSVRYDYLDYSTVNRRRACCAAELKLNRRTAPMLYRRIVAVTSTMDGGFALDGSGPVVDWLVEMNRFDSETQLDRLADRHELDMNSMPELADAIARLHGVAEWRFDHGGVDGLSWVVDGNRQGFIEYGEGLLEPQAYERVTAQARALLDRHRLTLDARRLAGFVRHCHGDLHLGNVCLMEGKPTLFDGVEFNLAVACIDVMYDLAFLLMDLLTRRLGRHANAVFNRYVERTDDIGGVSLLPLFLSTRAAVRAKTSATAVSLNPDSSAAACLCNDARRYLAAAEDCLVTREPRFVVIGGGSGSGKTTLARRVAAGLGPWPGALILRSDVERKRLMGVSPETRLGSDGYTQSVTHDVYRQLAEQADAILRDGHAVVIDAVCGDPLERGVLADIARARGVRFTPLWLDAPLSTTTGRLERRVGDASDATADVAARQFDSSTVPDTWTRLDAAGDADSVEQSAIAELRRPL